MAVGAALFAAGLAIKTISQLQASEEKASFLEQQAGLRRLEAAEIIRRGKIDLSNITREGQALISKQQGAFVKGGVDISSNTSLSVLEDTQRLLSEQILERQRELEFQASAVLAGASSKEAAATQIREAGLIGALGEGLGGAGQFAAASGKT